jgi:hypothetical protein
VFPVQFGEQGGPFAGAASDPTSGMVIGQMAPRDCAHYLFKGTCEKKIVVDFCVLEWIEFKFII